MSLCLPPAGSHLRTLFDVEQLAKVKQPSDLPSLLLASLTATGRFIDDTSLMNVYTVCIRNEYVTLIKFHRSGFLSSKWVFGHISELSQYYITSQPA